MKNDYNKKKRTVIITLSALAVCLTVGLFWYMGILGSTQPLAAQPESQTERESTVAVPETKLESTPEPIAAASETVLEAENMPVPETTPEPESMPEPDSKPEPESTTVAGTVKRDVKEKPSDGKPKSPEEATPPSEPPEDTPESDIPIENPDAGGQCQPEHTPQPEAEQPQGGEKQNGQIYVPGFGWIEDHGGGSEVHEAPNAGTGKPVGEM